MGLQPTSRVNSYPEAILKRWECPRRSAALSFLTMKDPAHRRLLYLIMHIGNAPSAVRPQWSVRPSASTTVHLPSSELQNRSLLALLPASRSIFGSRSAR